jgi:hypothetical protein
MDFDIGDALQSLTPGAEWVMTSGDYETLQWLSEDMKKPTKIEIETEIQRLREEKPWKELRKERNKRLTEWDWVAMKAFTTDTPVPDEWKVYMQALRDLPANTTDPENPIWPTPPTP